MINKLTGYNISPQLYGLCTELQAVGTSPFMLIFRRLPLSPADISIPEAFDAPHNVLENFVELLAKDQSATYKKKMKEYYDKNKTTDR